MKAVKERVGQHFVWLVRQWEGASAPATSNLLLAPANRVNQVFILCWKDQNIVEVILGHYAIQQRR